MSKVPQRDEIWKHKEKGYLARVVNVSGAYIDFYDTQDGYDSVENMANGSCLEYFMEDYVFIGNGKPLDVLFEVQDDSN